MLYTDGPTETLEEALVGVMDYATRFLIEEFHKGLKTGLKAEELQLETAAPPVRGDRGDEHGGACDCWTFASWAERLPEAPAACTGLDDLELELLGLAVSRELTTVASVLLALGRLGGHMNRRSDGMPGWITLWRGMKTLRLLVRGAELERRRNDKHVHS